MDNLPPLLLPEQLQLSAEEIKQVTLMLSNPSVQKYFERLHLNAMTDVLENEAETPEQEQKFVARFKKFKGVQYLCIFIKNNFGVKGSA